MDEARLRGRGVESRPRGAVPGSWEASKEKEGKDDATRGAGGETFKYSAQDYEDLLASLLHSREHW